MNKPAAKTKKTQSSSATQKTRATQVSAARSIQDIPNSGLAAPSAFAHDVIARRAFEIYIEKGCPQGQSEQIWHQAERDLRSQSMMAAMSK